MTYDDMLMLVSDVYSSDEKAVEIKKATLKSVMCNKKSVSTSVFCSARQEGLKPTYVFTIHRFEYDGQQEVEYNRKRYSVIRTYDVGFDEVELTVAEVVGV